MANTNRTFIQLQDAVRIEMQLDPGLISVEERKQFINDAIADLGDIAFFEKDVVLPVVNGEVELPDDYVQPVLVTAADGRPLRPMPMDTVIVDGSTPIGYIHKFNKLLVYPRVNNVNINIVYAYRPQRLVADTDQPDIPNGFDALIVDYAVAKCHRKNGNVALFREYMGYYEGKKGSLIQELIRRANSRIVPMHNQDGLEITANIDILI